MGLPAFAGSVPAPGDAADLATSAIGQGRVLVSPLNMAVVAASIDSGEVRPARLVAGAADDASAPRPLPGPVVSGLRQMMARVVASGTASGTGLPAGTYAKTGTAEYGSGQPQPVDAWLMGYRGDVAFAVVVQNAPGNGGPTGGPIITRFLNAIGSST
jgi:cell division protein FtsI/penicillin-binding protein 2